MKKPTRLRRSRSDRSQARPRAGRLPGSGRPLEIVLALVALALVVIALLSLGGGSSSSSAATKRTSEVGNGVVQSTVSGNGKLEPAQKVELNFGASGEVTAIKVKAGEKVEKGQVLAEVDSSSARASLASAEAQLIEAEEAVETAEEGETEDAAYTGEATTVLVGLMSESGTGAAKQESTEGEATPEGTEAGVTTPGTEAPKEGSTGTKEAPGKATTETPGKGTTETPGTAKEGSAGTESTAPTGEGEAPASEEPASEAGGAVPSAGTTEGATAPSGGVTEGAASGGAAAGATGGASVSLPTAEANLREAELSLKSARQEVRETTLRAPISGTIASVSGSVGETVTGGSSSQGGTSEASGLGAIGGESAGESSGSAFIVLAQLHRLKLEVSFSEADIGKVRKGQTATVAVDSLEGTELAGKVTKVSVLPNEGSSSVVEYPATILLTQSAKGLRAGMSASAEVVVEQVKDAVTVPSEAISQGAGGKTVTVEEGGKEVTKTVTTGLEGDETTEVVSGVQAGETLVLPEVNVASAAAGAGGEGGPESGGFPGGGSLPSFSGGGPSGFSPPSGGGFPGGGP